jgi:hypothetical protein
VTEDDPLAIAQRVIEVCERLDARYSIGGSIASAFAGEPRSTLDVDIVVSLTPEQADALADALNRDFYLDRARLQHAVATRTSANLIHLASAIKIDLFVAGGTPLDGSLLARRRLVVVGDPPREVFVHTPEDILLQKLRWFRLGGETSDRQWRDVLAIVHVQDDSLDRTYLSRGAETLGVADLLERAVAAAR